MNNTQVGLLWLQAIASVTVISFLAFEWFKGREARHKYKLYAIRDELLYLVVSQKLSQEDFLFKLFYRVINRSINEIKHLTFWSFIRASMTAKSELEKETTAGLQGEIQRAPEEVRKVIAHLCVTMMEIMLANSLSLFLAVEVAKRCRGLLSKIQHGSKFLAKTLPQYETYRYFEGLVPA